MNKGVKIFLCVVFGVLMVAAITYFTMHLWNWLVPTLFKGPVINFWQMLGLLVLTKILFWGFGGKRQHSSYAHKQAVYEKFSNMSPEERDAFKNKMKEKWCRWDKKDSLPNPPASND